MLSPAEHPCSALFFLFLPQETTLWYKARKRKNEKNDVPCKISGDPQTPLCWVFHLLSAKEIDYFRKVYCLSPTSMMFCLQIRDDHHHITIRVISTQGKKAAPRTVYFLRKEQPSVNLALPPVGWHRTVVHPWQMTTVWA